MQIHSTCIYIFILHLGMGYFQQTASLQSKLYLQGAPVYSGKAAMLWRRGQPAAGLSVPLQTLSPWWMDPPLELKQLPISPLCGWIIKSRQDNRIR